MTTGNDKIKDEVTDMLEHNLRVHDKGYEKLVGGELYNKEAFDKLIKEANDALGLGSEEQISAELAAVIDRHEETIKLSPVLPPPLMPLREALKGGFRPDETVVLAFPHPVPLMDRLYYSLDRSKHREPPILPVRADHKIEVNGCRGGFLDPKLVPPIEGTKITDFLDLAAKPSPGCKSDINQRLHIQIWYAQKGKKNPFRDLNVYGRMYDEINNPMPSDEGWVIDENCDPNYVPPKDLKDKSVKHLKRTIRQIDKRLQQRNQKYVRLHYIYMRSLTVSALKMKKEVK